MPRIASLLPSATEIVCALGAFDQLCAVSHECDWPPQVAAAVLAGSLPVVTSARLGPPGPLGPPPGSRSPDDEPAGQLSASGAGPGLRPTNLSRWIDDSLRELLRQALAVYTVDESALAAAQPDIVLTQDLCEVCAVSYSETCRAVGMLTGRDVQVVNTHPTDLECIFADIQNIASAIGRPADGTALVAQLRKRFERLEKLADEALVAAGAGLPLVLALEWLDPLIPGGLWVPELIDYAGGCAEVVTLPGAHPVLDLDTLQTLQPDVLVLQPCGFTLEQTLGEVQQLRHAIPWENWPACRQGRVYACDGSAYFNRPGPRIADTAELLAACIHPKVFSELRPRFAGAVATIHPDLTVERW